MQIIFSSKQNLALQTKRNYLRREVKQLKFDLQRKEIKPHTRKRAEKILLALESEFAEVKRLLRIEEKHRRE